MNCDLFCLNSTPREESLMRDYTGAYWCARVAATGAALLACGASCGALEMVRAFLVSIGLLRFGLAGGPMLDEGSGSAYALCAGIAFCAGALAWGLWTFRLWAWWVAMGGSLVMGLVILFEIPDWAGAIPLLCLVYALLVPSYAIFTERDDSEAKPAFRKGLKPVLKYLQRGAGS